MTVLQSRRKTSVGNLEPVSRLRGETPLLQPEAMPGEMGSNWIDRHIAQAAPPALWIFSRPLADTHVGMRIGLRCDHH